MKDFSFKGLFYLRKAHRYNSAIAEILEKYLSPSHLKKDLSRNICTLYNKDVILIKSLHLLMGKAA